MRDFDDLEMLDRLKPDGDYRQAHDVDEERQTRKRLCVVYARLESVIA